MDARFAAASNWSDASGSSPEDSSSDDGADLSQSSSGDLDGAEISGYDSVSSSSSDAVSEPDSASADAEVLAGAAPGTDGPGAALAAGREKDERKQRRDSKKSPLKTQLLDQEGTKRALRQDREQSENRASSKPRSSREGGVDGEESVTRTSKERKRDTKRRRSSRKEKEPGLVYLSRIPPFMQPPMLRAHLGNFGELGRVWLSPEDDDSRKRRVKRGGSRRTRYTEGWVEFQDKRLAKRVALSLNNTNVGTTPGGGGKHWKEDLWNIKYLPKFRWADLTASVEHERRVRQQRLRTELSAARREADAYREQHDKRRHLEKVTERRAARAKAKEEKKRAREDSSAVEERAAVGRAAEPRASKRQRREKRDD